MHLPHPIPLHPIPSPCCPLPILSPVYLISFPLPILPSSILSISYPFLHNSLPTPPNPPIPPILPPLLLILLSPTISLPFLILFHFILSWPLPSSQGVLTSNKEVDSSISFHAFLKIFAFLDQIFRSSIQDVDVG